MEGKTDDRAQVTITVPADDLEVVRDQLTSAGVDFIVASSEGFDGRHAADILLTLTPSIAAFVAGLYATRVRANRFTLFKGKGRLTASYPAKAKQPPLLCLYKARRLRASISGLS